MATSFAKEEGHQLPDTAGVRLEQLLESRDRRAAYQQELLRQYAGKTLVCLTIVMPGSVKRSEPSLIVAHAAVEALQEAFRGDMIFSEERDLPTGFELFMVVGVGLMDAKRRVCHIEETHPLGRLFDIDVIRPDGVPVSRTDLGLSQRRCIICSNEARYCMRNHSHTQEELHTRINELIECYVHGV